MDKYDSNFKGVDSVKTETVIITTRWIGTGDPNSPLRPLKEIWTMDGEKLGSNLPMDGNYVLPAFRQISPQSPDTGFLDYGG